MTSRREEVTSSELLISLTGIHIYLYRRREDFVLCSLDTYLPPEEEKNWFINIRPCFFLHFSLLLKLWRDSCATVTYSMYECTYVLSARKERTFITISLFMFSNLVLQWLHTYTDGSYLCIINIHLVGNVLYPRIIFFRNQTFGEMREISGSLGLG